MASSNRRRKRNRPSKTHKVNNGSNVNNHVNIIGTTDGSNADSSSSIKGTSAASGWDEVIDDSVLNDAMDASSAVNVINGASGSSSKAPNVKPAGNGSVTGGSGNKDKNHNVASADVHGNKNTHATGAIGDKRRSSSLIGYDTVTPEDARKQTIIGIIVVVVIIALIVGVVAWRVIAHHQNEETTATSKDSAYTAMNASDAVKPSEWVTDDGAIVFNKDGIVENPSTSAGTSSESRTVDAYMDFNCPGCGSVDRSLTQYYQEYLSSGQIVLNIHPIAFLDAMSTDDYSTRAANSVYRLLDVAPDKVYDYVTYLFSDGVQPGEGTDYEPFTDDDLQEAAVSVGVPESDAAVITDCKYADYVRNVTTYVTNDKTLWRSNATSFATPVVLVDGQQLTFDGTDGFLEQFVRLVEDNDDTDDGNGE